MPVLPPDLPRLRTLVTFLHGGLARAEQALAVTEERDALASSRRPPKEPRGRSSAGPEAAGPRPACTTRLEIEVQAAASR
ncbi:hypothetical protein OG765_29205 [Streptomyces sp. NBC_00555]|uniref:hypothetical protein n=1 Tax=Streptomyces sp. NBC_00555 TaxID=2903662 RepID=UPI0022514BBF|nr:hypothetical protein [Streptomyces sp. NBC_00555]MCX5015016.1 hypothetical protein [Streptomyces sp. NBC_00555]